MEIIKESRHDKGREMREEKEPSLSKRGMQGILFQIFVHSSHDWPSPRALSGCAACEVSKTGCASPSTDHAPGTVDIHGYRDCIRT
jgi:hypothetical protein